MPIKQLGGLKKRIYRFPDCLVVGSKHGETKYQQKLIYGLFGVSLKDEHIISQRKYVLSKENALAWTEVTQWQNNNWLCDDIKFHLVKDK